MYKNKSILAIIPARGGSKGVPRKNIKNLFVKPMIAWTIEAAKNSKYIDRVIVSTEDEEIADIANGYGAQVPFLRPKELAQDNTPGVDPVLYTVEKLETMENYKSDFILLLQPTSPLRNEKHIDESVEILFSNTNNFNSLISVTELEHPVYWNRTMGLNKELKSFIEYNKEKYYRRQDFEKIYRLNGAIYLIETKTLEKYKNFETDNTMAYVMNRISSIDVDTIDDFELAEFYLSMKGKGIE